MARSRSLSDERGYRIPIMDQYGSGCRFNQMHKSPDNTISESKIARAYVALLLVRGDKYGDRTVSLARLRNYEIRLIEVSLSSAADLPPLWIELYAHGTCTVIDSCACDDLEAAAAAAEHLITQARGLVENGGN